MELKKVSSWEDVTLKQLLDLKAVDPLEVDTSTGLLVKKVSILCEVEEEVVEELDVEELMSLALVLSFANEDPTTYKERIENYVMKPFSKLTLGEFITLDVYVSTDYIKNAAKIISIIYRRWKIGEFGSEELEQLGKIDIEKRAEEMLNAKAGEVFGVIAEFLKFRERFMERYADQFEGDDDEDDEEEEMSEAERLREEAKRKKLKKWAWHSLIYRLCQGDLTKIEAVTELELEMVFTFGRMKDELKLE